MTLGGFRGSVNVGVTVEKMVWFKGQEKEMKGGVRGGGNGGRGESRKKRAVK